MIIQFIYILIFLFEKWRKHISFKKQSQFLKMFVQTSSQLFISKYVKHNFLQQFSLSFLILYFRWIFVFWIVMFSLQAKRKIVVYEVVANVILLRVYSYFNEKYVLFIFCNSVTFFFSNRSTIAFFYSSLYFRKHFCNIE